jgi:hypothetical protein
MADPLHYGHRMETEYPKLDPLPLNRIASDLFLGVWILRFRDVAPLCPFSDLEPSISSTFQKHIKTQQNT